MKNINYEILEGHNGIKVKSWTKGVPFEDEAKKQLLDLTSVPGIFKHIAVMPDVHAGIGSTIGSVIATKKIIIPAAVSVDIGCGILTAKTNLQAKDLPDSLSSLRTSIESAVPHGRTDNGGKNDRGAWSSVPNQIQDVWKVNLFPKFSEIISKHPKAQAFNSLNHLGTLGTGNHFIEVCLDESQAVWVMLHSGSRGLGNRIGTYFIDLAKKEMERWFINLPNADLAYLPEGSQYYKDYVDAVHFAQDYAKINRAIMFESVMEAMKKMFPHVSIVETAINCFAGETKILTRNGIRRIDEITNTEQELLTLNGKWVKAPIKCFGKQQLYKITLSRSKVIKTIFATAQHGWFLSPNQRKDKLQRKTTIQLKKGDRLAYNFPQKIDVKINDHACARGFVFGDGSVSSKNKSRASFCGEKDKEMLEYFRDFNEPRVYEKQTVVNGLPKIWKTEFPNLDSDPDYLFSWLSGYFAADGDVDKTGRPTLASAKKENLEFVRRLCDKIGIGTFGIRVRNRKGFNDFETPLYLLGFMRQDLGSEFFAITKHRERFRNVAERRAWNVLSVEETDRFEDVFCAVVEKTHCFTLEDNILTQNCHHNYVEYENHFGENVLVTRKGAVRARTTDLGIIPGSMGAKSYIVRGKGNPDSFCSCSHGAGRKMSRTEAKKVFTVQDHIEATKGVECRKDEDVVDETPAAYKDIDSVMEAQSDLVEIVHTLKQLLCVKG